MFRRDFRLESIGEAWRSTELTQNEAGHYVVEFGPSIQQGWMAWFIEVQYGVIDLPGLDPVIESYTTEVTIFPDSTPFEPFDCAQPMAIKGGMWWDPATNGQGMDVNRFNDTLIFGPWYLYDENGMPLWVTFTGELEGTRARGVLREHTGPLFGQGFDLTFDPGEVTERVVGQGSIAFLGTGNGVFHYGFDAQSGGIHGDLNIEEIDSRPDGVYSGHWFKPSQPGHGFQFNHKDNVIFGTWYSYDEAGNPTWSLFVGSFTSADSASAQVYAFTGPPLSNEPWQAELLEERVVGSMMLEFSDDGMADVTITVNGVSGQYSLVRIESGQES
jgi:hypothetical protein